MKHRLALFIILFLFPAASFADEDYSWCQGYVVGALGEFPVKGLSRTNLWLDWNVIVAETLGANKLNPDRYQAGRDHFTRLHHDSNAQAIIETSEEDCALGRNPGWIWW